MSYSRGRMARNFLDGLGLDNEELNAVLQTEVHGPGINLDANLGDSIASPVVRPMLQRPPSQFGAPPALSELTETQTELEASFRSTALRRLHYQSQNVLTVSDYDGIRDICTRLVE